MLHDGLKITQLSVIHVIKLRGTDGGYQKDGKFFPYYKRSVGKIYILNRKIVHLMINASKNLRLEWIMKYGIIIFIAVLIVACDKFPANPSKIEPPEKTVFIEYTGTDYVSAESQVEGIIANKVNVLSFEIRIENFVTKSLEFYGKAILEGPPEYGEHSIHFSTDEVALNPEDTGYSFNTLEFIQSGPVYTVVRAKFPTNEYSPFSGTQGKVIQVEIIEVWAYDENGEQVSVKMIEGSIE